MPTVDHTTEFKFASSEARISLFGGVCLLVATVNTFSEADFEPVTTLILGALALHQFWLAAHCRHVPYVQLLEGQLIVFEQGKPKHYLPFSQIAEVSKGFNRTNLLMHDGLRISISHLNFIKSEDATTFRAALATRIASVAA